MARAAEPKTLVPLLAAAILLLASTRLTAQTEFTPRSATETLAITGSVSGGYDGNDTSTSPAIGLSPIFQRSTTHFGGDVFLRYSNPGRRVGWSAGIGTAFRLYQAADTLLFNHNAGVGASAGVTRHIVVSASLFGGYSPPFQANLFPSVGQVFVGQGTVAPLQNSLTTTHLVNYGVTSSLTYEMTKRSALLLGHSYRRVGLVGSSFGGSAQDTEGSYHLGLTKNLGFRVGYRETQFEFDDTATGSTSRWQMHNLDIGLDYGLMKGLTLSRRTTLDIGFGLGSYLDQQRRVRLTGIGNATLHQQLFRTWSLDVGYHRGVGFVDGFRVPVFSDALHATVQGQLSRRLSAYGSAYYSFDRFDAISGSRFQSYRGVAGLRAMLTRQLDAFVQYVNLHHAFPDNALLFQGSLPTPNRQGISAGLSFGIPIIGNTPLIPTRQPS
jgi:hypothetical protein